MTNQFISKKLIILIISISFMSFLFTLNIVTASEQKLENTKYILVFDNNHTNPITSNKKPKQYRNAKKLIPRLNASASAQPNLYDFKYIINKAKAYIPNKSTKNIVIVDLRKEPHAILNEYAVSWYGFRNQLPNNLEQSLINQMYINKNANNSVRVYRGFDKLIDGYFMPKGYSLIKINKIVTEKSLVEKELGVKYLRILVTDHFAPDRSEVDLFVNFVKQLPKNSWLHFHCRGGKGRSTTFMVMYDMIINGQQLTLDAILKRQYKLGGSRLSNTNSFLDRNKWKKPAIQHRYNFIQNFYKYVLDPNGYNKFTWSEWLKKNS